MIVWGVLAGAMLAFVVSLDDVIITLMIAGPGETTLPIFILGQIRRGVTPEINAIGTLVLATSLMLLIAAQLLLRSRRGGPPERSDDG